MPETTRESRNVRLGYLVPEFPGQTHIMFWREIEKLQDRGVDVRLVSTRRPHSGFQVHAWSGEASRGTAYLVPPGWRGIALLTGQLARAGPRSLHSVWKEWRSTQRRGLDRLRLLAAVGIGAQLAGLSRVERWDHLHVHSCASSADAARFARLLHGPPYTLTLHGPVGDYGPDQRAKWRRASAGTVITTQLEMELREVVGEALPDSVTVTSMAADTEVFRRSTPYQPWDGHGPVRIFSCGRLNPAKGHADLITAVADLRRSGMPVTCVIAGEDEQVGKGYRTVLQRLIDGADLGDAVSLVGAVPEGEIARALHECHVFVLASKAEPLGVAIMEAMAAGVPVVVTDAGGVPELVTDGHDGLLVPPGRPDLIQAAVHSIVASPVHASELADAARRSALRRATRTTSAEVLLQLASQSRRGVGTDR